MYENYEGLTLIMDKLIKDLQSQKVSRDLYSEASLAIQARQTEAQLAEREDMIAEVDDPELKRNLRVAAKRDRIYRDISGIGTRIMPDRNERDPRSILGRFVPNWVMEKSYGYVGEII
jgi:hypothetical protein